NAAPAFSPDGKMIAFQTDRDENMEIYSLEIASNYERRLTNHPARDEFPIFAPSGKFLAFTSTRNDTTHQYEAEKMRDIYFCDLEGNDVRQFTENLDDDWNPTFHPKGELLAFASSRDDVRSSHFSEQWSNLYLANLKTRSLTPLTSDNIQVGCPCFSPDGKWLVMNNNSTGKFHLYQLNLKKRKTEQLTFHDGNDAAPRFNPKGTQIVFFSDINGDCDLFLLDISTRNLQQLTAQSTDECYPEFSPDGKKIVYQAMVDGKFQIFWLDLTQPLLKDSLIKLIETKMTELTRENKRKPR
ncbi:PD40 domain-containing protein, partial [candidate division KSB1 bacterium]|nr:PD40 domain-containing protein [candidate division KSB1 bacterium]